MKRDIDGVNIFFRKLYEIVHCVANDAYKFFVLSTFHFIKIAGKTIIPSSIRVIFNCVSYPSTNEPPTEVYASGKPNASICFTRI